MDGRITSLLWDIGNWYSTLLLKESLLLPNILCSWGKFIQLCYWVFWMEESLLHLGILAISFSSSTQRFSLHPILLLTNILCSSGGKTGVSADFKQLESTGHAPFPIVRLEILILTTRPLSPIFRSGLPLEKIQAYLLRRFWTLLLGRGYIASNSFYIPINYQP